MRFISVLAAVGAAIGTTFDFGLALGVEPVSWVKVASPDAGFSASFDGQPQDPWADVSRPAMASHRAVGLAVEPARF